MLHFTTSCCEIHENTGNPSETGLFKQCTRKKRFYIMCGRAERCIVEVIGFYDITQT